MLGFVEPSFVWFGLTTWPDPNNVAWFLMRDFLRFSPWSGPSPSRSSHGLFCSPLWILCVGCRKRNFVIRVCGCRVSWEREKHYSRTLYFSLIIVKSLQLCGRRQIAKPRRYCLVRVIVFFGLYFLYFFVSHKLGIRVNSLQLVLEPRVRFEWEQWQRKQERHLE